MRWGVVGSLLTLLWLAAACGGSKQAVVTVTQTTSTEAATSASSTEHFTRDNWDLLDSDPETYTGASVEIVGRVFSSPERDEGSVTFQMWADPDNSNWNTVVGYADPSLRVTDGTYVRVTGTVNGKAEGTNAFGGTVSAPVVIAHSVKIVDATAAASPAIDTLGRAAFRQAGITITVRKIEIAPDETRVFVAVKNGSAYDFSIYSYSAKIVQGGRQYEQKYSSADYPELSSDLVPGAFTTGVIVFPALSPNHAVKLYLEGSSENYDVGDYGSLKWVFTWSR